MAAFILNLGACGCEELTLGSDRFIPGKNPDTRSVGV